MKLDTKKESFEHLVCVLSIMFGDAREEVCGHYPATEWEKRHKKEKRWYNEASKYLKSFIIELIRQQ